MTILERLITRNVEHDACDDGIFITRVLHTRDMTIAAGVEHERASGGHKGFVLEHHGLLHGHGLLNHAHVHVVCEAGLRWGAGDAEGGSASHLHVYWLFR